MRVVYSRDRPGSVFIRSNNLNTVVRTGSLTLDVMRGRTRLFDLEVTRLSFVSLLLNRQQGVFVF